MRIDGKRFITPMLVVMVAIGIDGHPVRARLDPRDLRPDARSRTSSSRPTRSPCWACASCTSCIGGLLERLVYLSQGLAVILGFIGVKLVLHALHANELPFINGGEHVEWAPEIPIWLSLHRHPRHARRRHGARASLKTRKRRDASPSDRPRAEDHPVNIDPARLDRLARSGRRPAGRRRRRSSAVGRTCRRPRSACGTWRSTSVWRCCSAIGVWADVGGAEYAGQFYAGWLTEYSLSVDNLFVFLLIMGKFAVPTAYQQTALLIGIILALVFRGLFIWAGAAVIDAFSWVFYLFGAFLVYTAWKVGREGEAGDDDEFHPPLVLRARAAVAAGHAGLPRRASSRWSRAGAGSSPRCSSSSSRSAPPTCCSRSTRSRRSSG